MCTLEPTAAARAASPELNELARTGACVTRDPSSAASGGAARPDDDDAAAAAAAAAAADDDDDDDDDIIDTARLMRGPGPDVLIGWTASAG